MSNLVTTGILAIHDGPDAKKLITALTNKEPIDFSIHSGVMNVTTNEPLYHPEDGDVISMVVVGSINENPDMPRYKLIGYLCREADVSAIFQVIDSADPTTTQTDRAVDFPIGAYIELWYDAMHHQGYISLIELDGGDELALCNRGDDCHFRTERPVRPQSCRPTMT